MKQKTKTQKTKSDTSHMRTFLVMALFLVSLSTLTACGGGASPGLSVGTVIDAYSPAAADTDGWPDETQEGTGTND